MLTYKLPCTGRQSLVTLEMFYGMSLLLISAQCSRAQTQCIPNQGGLLLTVKHSLIIVPCVLKLIGRLPSPFSDPFNWFTFICKAILVPLCCYSCSCISVKLCGNDLLQSQEAVLLSVPQVQTELGRRAFIHSVTSARKQELNESQTKQAGLARQVKTIYKKNRNLINQVYNYLYVHDQP